MKTIIIRHRKENLKKCSLRGLEQDSRFLFFSYPKLTAPDLSDYVVLSVDAPELSQEDAGYGICLLDGTWRYAQKMETFLSQTQTLRKRSLPKGILTAYPRKQEDCPDPTQGLASIEALYLAYLIQGLDTKGLLNSYHFSEAFLQKNALQFSQPVLKEASA